MKKISCYHPLVGIWKGEYTASGKKKYQIDGHLDPTDCPNIYDHILIPCGQCIGCRLDYSRSWADRMMLELETAKKGVFVTLTYDNIHVPCCDFVDLPEDVYLPLGKTERFDEKGKGYLGIEYTLDKRDCQLFMKRLRDKFKGTRISFYLSGEYGENTSRPHYHCILFGIGLDDIGDLYEHGRNELGQPYFISPLLSETWSRGFVLVANVTWQTCAYVSRYVTKKLKGFKSIEYAIRNRIPEFSLMSRNPGIGKTYLDLHPDCLDLKSINISTEDGGRKINIPKYYIKQLSYVPKEKGKDMPEKNPLYDPEKYDSMMKVRKECANDAMLIKLSKTNLTYLDYLEKEEEKKLKDIKKLPKRSKTEI